MSNGGRRDNEREWILKVGQHRLMAGVPWHPTLCLICFVNTFYQICFTDLHGVEEVPITGDAYLEPLAL